VCLQGSGGSNKVSLIVYTGLKKVLLQLSMPGELAAGYGNKVFRFLTKCDDFICVRNLKPAENAD